MEIFNNTTKTVGDDIKPLSGLVTAFHRLPASLSMHIELREQLILRGLRFIFTSPTLRRKQSRNAVNLYSRLGRERSLYGTEFEFSELKQKLLQKNALTDAPQSHFKSNTTREGMNNFRSLTAKMIYTYMPMNTSQPLILPNEEITHKHGNPPRKSSKC